MAFETMTDDRGSASSVVMLPEERLRSAGLSDGAIVSSGEPTPQLRAIEESMLMPTSETTSPDWICHLLQSSTANLQANASKPTPTPNHHNNSNGGDEDGRFKRLDASLDGSPPASLLLPPSVDSFDRVRAISHCPRPNFSQLRRNPANLFGGIGIGGDEGVAGLDGMGGLNMNEEGEDGEEDGRCRATSSASDGYFKVRLVPDDVYEAALKSFEANEQHSEEEPKGQGSQQKSALAEWKLPAHLFFNDEDESSRTRGVSNVSDGPRNPFVLFPDGRERTISSVSDGYYKTPIGKTPLFPDKASPSAPQEPVPVPKPASVDPVIVGLLASAAPQAPSRPATELPATNLVPPPKPGNEASASTSSSSSEMVQISVEQFRWMQSRITELQTKLNQQQQQQQPQIGSFNLQEANELLLKMSLPMLAPPPFPTHSPLVAQPQATATSPVAMASPTINLPIPPPPPPRSLSSSSKPEGFDAPSPLPQQQRPSSGQHHVRFQPATPLPPTQNPNPRPSPPMPSAAAAAAPLVPPFQPNPMAVPYYPATMITPPVAAVAAAPLPFPGSAVWDPVVQPYVPCVVPPFNFGYQEGSPFSSPGLQPQAFPPLDSQQQPRQFNRNNRAATKRNSPPQTLEERQSEDPFSFSAFVSSKNVTIPGDDAASRSLMMQCLEEYLELSKTEIGISKRHVRNAQRQLKMLARRATQDTHPESSGD